MFRPKTFGETIRPILVLNILCGTGSFVLSKEQKVGKFVESIYMVIVWISFNSIFFMQYFFSQYFVMTKVNMNFTLIMSWVVISYQMATVLIFITKFKMKENEIYRYAMFRENLRPRDFVFSLLVENGASNENILFLLFNILLRVELLLDRVSTVCGTSCILYAHITQDLIDTVDNINEKMLTIGLPNQYLTQYKDQMFHFTVSLIHITLVFVVTWIFRIEPNAPIMVKIGLTLASNQIQMMLMTVQLSFILWIGHIRTKFRQLNNLLEEMIEMLDHSGPKRFLEISECQVQKRRSPNVHALKGNIETIMKAKNYHLCLIKIARRINHFYGKQLLVTTLAWCFSIMTLLYMFNFCILSPLSGLDLFYTITPVVMGIMVIMSRMIHLHSNCMDVTNEAGKAGFLLCRLYNTSTSIEFRAEVQHFTHQVIENPLVFTVCGLVDIDRTFITSFVGSVFAYLIVIIQLAWPQVQNRYILGSNVTDVNGTVSYNRSLNLSVST